MRKMSYEGKEQQLFRNFEQICAIPRGSGNYALINEYLVRFAEERGFFAMADKFGNVLIKKPASAGREEEPTTILQSHLDIVCAKEDGIEFDFEKDPIIPIVTDDGWITARGTTLGGDDGIGVAMMLTILEDKSLSHPPLEMVFTADEEDGMKGAFGFDSSLLFGKRMINLDSEFDGVFLCSCAGGVNLYSELKLSAERATGIPITVRVDGLQGGHSGVEIHKGRANANVLIARLLDTALSVCSPLTLRLSSLEGGVRETAIASLCCMELIVAENPDESGSSSADDLRQTTMRVYGAIVEAVGELCREYASTDPDMLISVDMGERKKVENTLTANATRVVSQLLFMLPDGVQVMSPNLQGLVQTSVNFGLLSLKRNTLTFSNTVRSSVESQKRWICRKIRAAVESVGGTVREEGDYPGWAFNPKSVLLENMVECYEELFQEKPSVEAIHAGLECGLFAARVPNLECVSVGPQMEAVHTPREKLSIHSSEKTFALLKRILEKRG